MTIVWFSAIAIADHIKRQALQQQWEHLSETLPDVAELTEEKLLAEVEAVRTTRYRCH